MFLCLLIFFVLSGAGLATAVDVGDPAPDFNLPSTTGEAISLNQFKGKKNVLIQFYTMDFNPV
jgi:peroxiredoxin